MDTTLNQMKTGVALYTRLRDLLAGERKDLVKQELDSLDANNQSRQFLLSEIADWEGDVAHLLGRDVDDSGEGATLSEVIETMPMATQREATSVLTSLEAVAREARKLVRVNHILVERNLATVTLTLDAYTGGPAAKTYNAAGSVSRDGRHRLVTRR